MSLIISKFTMMRFINHINWHFIIRISMISFPGFRAKVRYQVVDGSIGLVAHFLGVSALVDRIKVRFKPSGPCTALLDCPFPIHRSNPSVSGEDYPSTTLTKFDD